MTQEPPQDQAQQPPGPPPPPESAATQAPPPPPPAPPGPSAQGTGFYQGPWPPPGATAPREGFWSVVWRTATRSVIIATVGGMAFAIAMLVAAIALAAVIGMAFRTGGGDDGLDTDFVFGNESAKDQLLIVRVDGVILGEKTDEPLFASGLTYGYEIKDILRRAAEEDDIRGVLLWMSTPGGTIYGSRAIADGVAEYRAATGNPVVAYVAGVSASGGMYAMSGADEIVADHGSLVGSIGVIFGPFTYYNGVVATEGGILGGGVTTTNGITYEYLTAGRSKDVGNPYRPLTDEERSVLQDGLNSEYEEFVSYVSEQRDIPPQRIRDEIGAMVYGNARAEEFGLIDATATLEQAYTRLADRAGLTPGQYKLVEESVSSSIFGALVQSGAGAEALAAIAANSPETCVPAGTYLAYWGDPSELCWR